MKSHKVSSDSYLSLDGEEVGVVIIGMRTAGVLQSAVCPEINDPIS